MNRNQRRMAAYNAMKAAEKMDVGNYCKKIERAFSRLSEDCSNRVTRATSLGSLRDKKEQEGSCCLPDVARFSAGHRTSKQVTAR